jgi:hypothetical protein
MLDLAGDDPGSLRGFLKIGAGSIARQHLALALACECTKIICISRSLSPELVSLQHQIEGAGARFHCIPGARALAGLVTADDDLFVVTDGLLIPQLEARDLLSRWQGIVVQPAEIGIASGFERIDAENAAAGLMRIPGRLVEQLNYLPADCDVASALTRIALQAGVTQRRLPAEARVKILRNQIDADVTEAEWFDLQFRNSAPMAQGIGMMVARQAVRLIGPVVLSGHKGSQTFALGSIVAILLALAVGWFGFIAVALFGCALAVVAALGCGILRQVERESLTMPQDRWALSDILGWIIDIALVAVLSWAMPVFAWESGWQRVFAPLMLLIVLRLVTQTAKEAWAGWLADRFLFCLILAGAALAGWLPYFVFGLALCLGLFGILGSSEQKR